MLFGQVSLNKSIAIYFLINRFMVNLKYPLTKCIGVKKVLVHFLEKFRRNILKSRGLDVPSILI